MNKPFIELLSLYEAGELSGDQLDEFFRLLDDQENQQILSRIMDEKIADSDFQGVENSRFTNSAWLALTDAMRRQEVEWVNPVSSVRMQRKWWIAASVVLLAGIASYFLLTQNSLDNGQGQGRSDFAATAMPIDVRPGTEGAILTLADGSQIVLDSLGNGVIASENGAEMRLENGQLAYTTPFPFSASAKDPPSAQWNTLTTPKGRQFSLQLPDGTRVWLNAASSIKFPDFFDQNERKVEITGEAYFEVKSVSKEQGLPNAKIPFIVSTKHQQIEVLGTQFNVNAYDDEDAERTTLLEGRVRIHNTVTTSQGQLKPASVPGKDIVLRPGQQVAVFTSSGGMGEAAAVDLTQVMAWKNGSFNFVNAGLESVMRQLARWYNIEVVYDGKIPDKKFWGEMGRDLNLKDVLEFLQRSQVNFRLEKDRRLIVYPN